MSACARCGFDPDAVVAASWSFFINASAASLNAQSTNKGGRRFAYKRARDAWGWWVRERRLALAIPLATGRRRVTLTRIYGGRQAEFDRDNLTGGMKPVVDCLVREGLITGDGSRGAEIHYLQERSDARRGVRVLLEEVS